MTDKTPYTVDALLPDEATPEMLNMLIPKAQKIAAAASQFLTAVRSFMDSADRHDYVEKWGRISPATESLYDVADLAQRVSDVGLSMQMMLQKPISSRQIVLLDQLRESLNHGVSDENVDPETGEIHD